MKKNLAYFGNRFAAFCAKKPTLACKKSKLVCSEMEALESRILLSGLTDGTKVLKSFSFLDADGDKVSISVTGALAANAGFQISDLGGDYDVDEINLVGLTKANSLVIKVAPSKLSPAVQMTNGEIYTPGYTNIGSITSDTQTNEKGLAVSGATAIRNIGLNAAIVKDISIANTDVFGSITLNTGKTALVDRINTISVAVSGDNTSYNPVAGLIDLNDITAKSIGSISINGVVGALYSNPASTSLVSANSTNDFNGSITTSGNLGGMTGLRSVLKGTVDVGGNLGNVNVGDLDGTLSATGNITINIPSGSSAKIVAGGHINLGFQANDTATSANLSAAQGISGLGASTSDRISIPSLFSGKLLNTSESTAAGQSVANIQVIGGSAAAFIVESHNKVGTITAPMLGAMNVIAGTGDIGAITTTAGGNAGTFTAATSIGAISTTGGTLSGIFTASTTIGDITATNYAGDALSANFEAGTSIGTITAKTLTGTAINGGIWKAPVIGNVLASVTGLNGGDAINGLTVNAGSIGTITAQNASTITNSNGIDSSNIQTTGSIGNISVTSVGTGITSSTFAADSDANNSGIINNITVAVSGAGSNGIEAGSSYLASTSFSGVSIGNISVTLSNTGGAGDAISNVSFTAQNSVLTTNATSKDTSYINSGTIGSITITNSSNNASADGIVSSSFNAGAKGSIATAGINIAVNGGAGINVATLNASNIGSGQSGTDLNSTIGAIAVSGNGSGIKSLTAQSSSSIGNISSTGVGNQSIDVTTTDAGNITFANLGSGYTLIANLYTTKTIDDITVGGAVYGTNGASLALSGSALTSIGNISTDGTANLSGITSGSQLTTIGAIKVATLQTPSSSFNGLTSLTSLDATTINSSAGAFTFGKGSTTTSAPTIKITSSATTSGNLVTFNFNNYTSINVNNASVTQTTGAGTAVGNLRFIDA